MSPLFSIPRKPATAGKRMGKARSDPDIIKITREFGVNEIIPIATVPDTWTVPITPTAYLVDASGSKALLTIAAKVLSLDTFIRAEVCGPRILAGIDRPPRGDVQVKGLTPNLNEKVLCRSCQFYCDRVDTCEFIDPDLFAECKHYEPDYEAMKELWNQELDSNEREAASATAIIPRAQKFDHIYWPIPAKADKKVLQYGTNLNRLPYLAPDLPKKAIAAPQGRTFPNLASKVQILLVQYYIAALHSGPENLLNMNKKEKNQITYGIPIRSFSLAVILCRLRSSSRVADLATSRIRHINSTKEFTCFEGHFNLSRPQTPSLDMSTSSHWAWVTPTVLGSGVVKIVSQRIGN
ncbi:hypothetical protein DFH09DRAFT_1081858 [Mycena vulgaris]|nr:hypothetical protein DFH09DRAFT_1081858 [Mycena vulgaris]